jgi:hypothetical protein
MIYLFRQQVLALLNRQQKTAQGQKGGQTVDVSIFESMWNLMEGIVPEYDRKGEVREYPPCNYHPLIGLNRSAAPLARQ